MKACIHSVYIEDSIPELNTGRAFSIWLKDLLASSLKEKITEGQSCGLYLTTGDLGAGSSIQFWREALKNGFAFANPREFPMTLSNSVASMIAIQLKITGPNYTFVGSHNVHNDAFIQALVDFQAMKINECLIVNIPLLKNLRNGSDQRTVITHLIRKKSDTKPVLATLELSDVRNQENKSTSLEKTLLNINKGNESEFFIQTDINKDILIRLSTA